MLEPKWAPLYANFDVTAACCAHPAARNGARARLLFRTAVKPSLQILDRAANLLLGAHLGKLPPLSAANSPGAAHRRLCFFPSMGPSTSATAPATDASEASRARLDASIHPRFPSCAAHPRLRLRRTHENLRNPTCAWLSRCPRHRRSFFSARRKAPGSKLVPPFSTVLALLMGLIALTDLGGG